MEPAIKPHYVCDSARKHAGGDAIIHTRVIAALPVKDWSDIVPTTIKPVRDRDGGCDSADASGLVIGGIGEQELEVYLLAVFCLRGDRAGSRDESRAGVTGNCAMLNVVPTPWFKNKQKNLTRTVSNLLHSRGEIVELQPEGRLFAKPVFLGGGVFVTLPVKTLVAYLSYLFATC